ncbi:hypothetical protein N7535_000735 [Penicillium sp. DV-2018c]|nr:hypothetical protein N7535_000735 [Penicillium sp. DV-2018c]
MVSDDEAEPEYEPQVPRVIITTGRPCDAPKLLQSVYEVLNRTYVMINIDQDVNGQCLYYFLSDQLYGNNHHADEIRQLLCQVHQTKQLFSERFSLGLFLVVFHHSNTCEGSSNMFPSTLEYYTGTKTMQADSSKTNHN